MAGGRATLCALVSLRACQPNKHSTTTWFVATCYDAMHTVCIYLYCLAIWDRTEWRTARRRAKSDGQTDRQTDSVLASSTEGCKLAIFNSLPKALAWLAGWLLLWVALAAAIGMLDGFQFGLQVFSWLGMPCSIAWWLIALLTWSFVTKHYNGFLYCMLDGSCLGLEDGVLPHLLDSFSKTCYMASG